MDITIKTWLMLLTGVLLFTSKALDIITTYRHIGARGEANALARRVFNKLGIPAGMVAIGIVYTVIVFAIGYQLTLETNPVLIYTTIAGGIIVAAIQFIVSYANATMYRGWPINALTNLFAAMHRALHASRQVSTVPTICASGTLQNRASQAPTTNPEDLELRGR